MSPQHLNNVGGDGLDRFNPAINFMIPPAQCQLSLSMKCFGERKGPELGCQTLNAPMEKQQQKTWIFQAREEENDGSDGGFGVGRKGVVYMNQGGEEEEGKRKFGRHAKLCCRGHWRPHEDAKLKELVAQYGPQNWNFIAEKLEGRSGKSCRLRWFNQLDPRINKRAFTEEEEERLLTSHRMYGNKWALIARLFPGRTDNAVKNHWHVIMARSHREHNSSVYKGRRSSGSALQKVLLPLPKGLSFALNPHQSNINACSDESTTISCNNVINDDQSAASTCTDISLTPSSARVSPPSLSRFSPVHQPQPHGLQMGSPGEKNAAKVINVALDQLYETGNVIHHSGPMVKVIDLEQSANSDSSSEVSATESDGNNRTNLNGYGEIGSGNEKKKNIVPFIDFLGVGTI